MKRVYLLSVLLFQLYSFAQNGNIGGIPVDNIIEIGLTSESNNSSGGLAEAQAEMTMEAAIMGNPSETGITKGSLSVSLTGGATYDIPIAVPPGINGVIPQLSLNYNSQSGNGLAGYGWNVSGVSVITRIPSTKFHDGIMDQVDFDALDRFSLDGQRLMVKNGTSGTYGADGTQYETENFSNTRITSYGVHPDGTNYGPSYFKVEYPDGSFAYYGNNSNSRSKNDWAITYWQNPQGVRISYTYVLSGNNLSISSIKYGARLTNTPLNEITFIYKTRQRAEQAYIRGVSFSRNTILSEIKVKGNGTGYRNYSLAHDVTSLGYQRIISVTEKSGDSSKSLRPVFFTYENTSESITFNPVLSANPLNISDITQNNSGNITGDFNGDGKLDFIIYPTTGVNAKNRYWLFTDVNQGNANLGWLHNVGTFENIFPVTWLNDEDVFMSRQGWNIIKKASNTISFSTYCAGASNPILFQYTKSHQFPKLYHGYLKYPCENGGGGPVIDPGNGGGGTSEPVWTVIEKEIPKDFISGDFNGDGLTDIVAIDKKITVSYQNGCQNYQLSSTPGLAYFIDLDRRKTTNFVFSSFLQVTQDSKYFVADYNGDGKSDIWVFDSQKLKIYTLNASNTFIQLLSITGDGAINLDYPILLGDYNGDGKTDFMIPNGTGNDFFRYISTGDTYFIKTLQDYEFEYKENKIIDGGLLHMHHLIPNDFNLDGKTDIIKTFTITRNPGSSGSYAQKIEVGHYKNKSLDNFETVNEFVSDFLPDLIHYPVPIFLDSNGSIGQTSLHFMSDNKIYGFQSNKSNIKDNLLRMVTLGNGLKEKIIYSPLAECPVGDNCIAAYNAASEAVTYPNIAIDIASSFYVVSKIEQLSANPTRQQFYKYYGAVSNAEGLGFLGFRKLTRTNWFENGNTAITTLSNHNISKRGAISETYTIQGIYFPQNLNPSGYITKATMAYQDELLTNKVFKIKNTQTVIHNSLDNTYKQTNSTYDNYNNVLTTEIISKKGTSVEFTQNNVIEYDNSTGSTYYIGRPKKKTISSTHNGSTITGEELYTYSSTQLLTKVRKKGHNTSYLTEDNVYDVFGNITQKTITATGLTPRISSFTYDSSGRFLLTSTDIEGLTSTFTYNTSNGNLLSESPPHTSGYPLTTVFEYDVWGRRTKTTDYLGKNMVTGYSWYPGDDRFFMIGNESDAGNISFEIFDQFGRPVAKTIRDISGNNWSAKVFKYDAEGRIKQESEPFFVSDPWSSLTPSQWNTTTYDVYGRIIQQSLYTGKNITTTYSGLSSTIDDGIKTTTVVKNSIGNIISLTDNGGTITYQHYPDGNLKSSSYGGVTVSIEQDGWGRKTKLIDPSAGTYTYQYNDFGELKKETTPKGTTTYTLDNFGKITKKTIVGDFTDSETTYTYDPNSKLVTEIEFDDSYENITTYYSYEYDNYRRLSKTTETTPMASFEKEMVYDDFGRLFRERYKAASISDAGKQSDKWVRHTYKNGYHWQILDDVSNLVLWQTNSVNARGQLTGGQYGNGVAVTNTYDQYGFPSEIRHQKTGGVTPMVMSVLTSFHPQRGNLIARYNNLFFLHTEYFEYDDLDRLVYMENDRELVQFNDFEESEGGFYSQNGSVLTLDNGRLKVTGTQAYARTEKVIATQAQIGDKYNVRVYVDKGNTQQVRVVIVEANLQTGQWNQSIKIIQGNAEFVEFQHTVSQYPVVKLHIDKSNTSDTGTSTYFYADNFEAYKIVPKEITYDDRGRIEENSSIGEYGYYDAIKAYRAAQISLNESGQLYYDFHPMQSIDYNAFKAPVTIFEENKELISFRYNAFGQRATMFYGGLQESKTDRPLRKHYAADGSMEMKHNTQTGAVEFVTYIGGDAYTAPVVFRYSYPAMLRPSGSYLYLHRDYQGTIVAISNPSGQVMEKRLFDAWGNIVRVQDGQGNILAGLTVLDRGYTGHEHLQGINIIHMNGRLYDPVTHRFLSPDNFIQDPFNTQNFNRYGYCYNNPFMYTDPSGEWIHIVAGAIIGGVVNLTVKAVQGKINSWGDGFAAFGIGAAAGAIGAATGGVAFTMAGGAAGGVGGFGAGAVSGMVGTAFASPIQSMGNSVYFGDPLMTLKQYVTGIAIGGLIGGTINGGIAALNGRNFWNGNTIAQGRNAFTFNNTPKFTSRNTDYSLNSGELNRVINPETISETIENFGIYAQKNNPIYKNTVDEYLRKMNSGAFELSKNNAAGGFIKDGNVYITSGHHRVVAATIRGMQTGDYKILEFLINSGNFSGVNPSQYGYSITKFPIWWQ